MLQTTALLIPALLAVLSVSSSVSALPDLNSPRLVVDSHQHFDVPAGAVVAEGPHDMHARDSFLNALKATPETVEETVVESVDTDKAERDWLHVIGARDVEEEAAEAAEDGMARQCKQLGAKCRKDSKCCEGGCIKKHALSMYGVCAYL